MRHFVRSAGIAAGLSAIATLAAFAGEMPATIRYCHGFDCKLTSTVRFSAADMARLRAIMGAGKASAEAERKALGKADQWYERIAGAATGTSSDRKKGAVTDAFDATQLDCIDESTNTTTLLKLIDGRGWLTHHAVGKTKSRGFLIDLRYPHNTATVIEKATGEAWAIDSWIPANAGFPDIMPVKIWVTKGVRGES